MSTEPPRKVRKMISESAETVPTTKSIDELKAEVRESVAEEKKEEKKAEEKKAEEVDKYQFNKLSQDGTNLRFLKLSENATTPMRGSEHSAGFDLCSAECVTIPPCSNGIARTDIAIAVPKGTYGRVAPRSGLAVKKFIDVGAGVVDYDYRGNVGVVLFNHKNEPFVVNKGDRIAQLVIEKICMPELVEVKSLDATERGAGGYGSTGIN